MHENDERTAGALPVLRPGLECIPIRSDPGRVSVSGMHSEDAILKEIHIRIEQQSTLFEVMEKVGCVIGSLASLGMVYVLTCMIIRARIVI